MFVLEWIMVTCLFIISFVGMTTLSFFSFATMICNNSTAVMVPVMSSIFTFCPTLNIERWFDAPAIAAGKTSFNVNPKPTATAAPMAIAILHENADTRVGITD